MSLKFRISGPGSWLRYLQLFSLGFALIIAGVFFRNALRSSSELFKDQFEKQNFIELVRGDTFHLARRLEALSKTENLKCIRALKGNATFYESINGDCNPLLFGTVESIKRADSAIRIEFTFTLPATQVLAIVLLTVIQILIGVLAVFSQRSFMLSLHRKDLEVAKISRQIAHDIRSPIAVLLNERSRVSFSTPALSALKRLINLIDNLVGTEAVEVLQPALKIINEVVAEKGAEFGSNVKITVECPPAYERILLRGSGFLWRRVLSNIINNAYEAKVDPVAKISLSVDFESDVLKLIIRDEGKGLPEEIKARLGRDQVTFGKEKGSGIGLSTAWSFIRPLGGSVSFRSEPGWTEVILQVPARLTHSVVLIDDDHAIASIWRLACKKEGFVYRHFNTFEKFYDSVGDFTGQELVFLDGEFDGRTIDLLEAGRILQSRGFREIYIASGRPRRPDIMQGFFREQTGKVPPWLPR